MKRIVKGFVVVFTIVTLFICKEVGAKAPASNHNVTVTVPATFDVVFEEDGSTSISEFYLFNDSLVPIKIQSIVMTEFNEWKLVQNGYDILVDKKELCLQLDGTTLMAGINNLELDVPYGKEHVFQVKTKRGAWTHAMSKEKAFRIEVQYAIGTREFVMYLDGNEVSEDIQIYAENGELVTLPSPERAGYVFAGWKDESGETHENTITMPIGDIRLTAQWIKADAYATYCDTDKSLNFYRSIEPIEANTVYKGKIVTAVYTGFENAHYGWGQTPWHSMRTKIERVLFHDIIQPIDMAHWFLEFYYANYADMRKLDTSRVTSMEYMCNKFGVYVEQLEMIGLENWDISNVGNMFFAFCYVGRNADGDVIIGDLSRWNVSNVTNMCRAFSDIGTCTPNLIFCGMEYWNTEKVENMGSMFQNTGESDLDWSLDLSKWNVNKVTAHGYFNENVESKIIPPNWVK